MQQNTQIQVMAIKNLRSMYDHLFMPRKLSLIHSEVAETNLMESLVQFLSREEDWKNLQPLVSSMSLFHHNPPMIQQLVALFKQDTFIIAVPLLNHNAVLLFNGALPQEPNTPVDKKTVLISAIDVLPHANSIHSLSSDQTPYPSDCRMAVPRSTVLVSLKQIQSTVFLEQLVELSKEWPFPGREVTVRQAEDEVTETTKPANPTYIFDWLMSTLVEELPPNRPQQTHPVVVKRFRLESIRQNVKSKPWNRSNLWLAAKSSLHVAVAQLTGGSRVYKSIIGRFQSAMVELAVKQHREHFDFGEIKEMTAYLSRKVEKLQQHHPEAGDVIDDLCQMCEKVDKILAVEWSTFLERQRTNSQINMKELESLPFASDTLNPLTSARPALQAAIGTDSLLQKMRTSARRPPLPAVPQHISFSKVLSSVDQVVMFQQLIDAAEKSSLSKNEMELESVLQTTEYFIRTLWFNRHRSYTNVEAVVKGGYDLLNSYQKHADDRYSGEAIRWGKRVLYSFALVAWMDAVCVRWDPLQLLSQHQIFTVDRAVLEKLLVMDGPDLALLEEVYEYCTNRSVGLKPGFLDLTAAGLPCRYALKDKSMIQYQNDYALEVERLSREKLIELNSARDGHSVQSSVFPYEKRLPENIVHRYCIIFHHKIPKVLQFYRDSCALLIQLFLVNHEGWAAVQDSAFQWNETPFNLRVAIGSNTKSFLDSPFKMPSIQSSEDNFILPQNKKPLMVMQIGSQHKFVPNCSLQFDVSKYCKLPVCRPYTRLEFAVHGVNHDENEVIALQSECPVELQLIAFKDFGSLRAGGGSLQWRNIAVALEGGTLDLNHLPVLMLILLSVYQVGPVPTASNWNSDLTENKFVVELCRCVDVQLKRIEESWSSNRSLYTCIAVVSYVVQIAPKEVTSLPWSLLIRCRTIAVRWSDSIEKLISCEDSSTDDLKKTQLHINGLIVLTFGVYNGEIKSKLVPECSAEDIFFLLRARVLMFERDDVPKDFELKRLHVLCYRIVVRMQQTLDAILATTSDPLSRIVQDRWDVREIRTWKRTGTFYEAECIACDGSPSTVHIHPIEGIFLVDGTATSRLPEKIWSHPLFKRAFKNPQISVFHRGGGIFETKSGKLQHTFAYDEASGSVIIREIDHNGCSRRLIDSNSFTNDLPHPLFSGFNFWMSLDGGSKVSFDIELRPLNPQQDELPVAYRILLDSQLHGRVTDCKSNRIMLNFNGSILPRLFNSFLWRLDQKQFVLPWLPLRASDDPTLNDQWSLCVELHRLHLHVEIWTTPEGTRVVLREFDNMTVSPSQFLDTFVGLKHMLVLERPNKLETVIVPNFNLQTEQGSAHHQLVPVSFDLNETIPFFAFDVDRFLRQMRPNGTETHISWLMCAYLHAATSSAMKDPLTGLTGLEMAVTQLRRCYLNKPFDRLSLDIFSKIEQLSVKRAFSHDKEVINWDENRSSYSSSEVYAFLVYCIVSRSQDLSELHGIPTARQVVASSKFAAAKKGYAQYERIYSEEARLNKKEKSLLGYSSLPFIAAKVEFTPNVIHHTNPVYHVMHAFRCQKELGLLGVRRSSKPLVFPSNPPPLTDNSLVERHVGKWCSGTTRSIPNWLWLYLEALESRSRPNEIERAERLAFYLSFVVYKWLTSGSADVDLLLQVTVSAYPPAVPLQEYINTRINFHMDQLDSQVHMKLQQVRRFCLRLNQLVPLLTLANQPIIQRQCGWPCGQNITPSIKLLQPAFVERNEQAIIGSSLASVLKVTSKCLTGIANGQSSEIETAFANCLQLKEKSISSARAAEVVVDFPFSTSPKDDDDVIGQPIGQDIVTDLQSSWQKYHDVSSNKACIVLVSDIRAKLEFCTSLAQQRVDESWIELQHAFTPVDADKVNRSRKAAGLSSLIAPRTLFPYFAKLDSLPNGNQRVVELLGNHLSYIVYLQKAIRCLDMLNTLDKMEEGEDKNHYAIRLIREIQEVHCSNWTPTEEQRKWLLFEVESDVMIRRIQADVAKAIIDGDKRVLQLNMGEGKTSVICPLVVSSLANKNQVIQLTFLTSLLETHGTELTIRLGGLLEQRVFYFPCNRQIDFTKQLIQQMIQKFNECRNEGGCIVTVPEHRLSMLLKFEELCIHQVDYYGKTTVPGTAQRFLDLFKLHKESLVDIIDESDEILRHRYQLLYAMGKQQSVDGGERRWKVAQELLNLLRRHAHRFSATVSAESLVVKSTDGSKGTGSWPYVRLIDAGINHLLREKLVECVLEGAALELSYVSTLSSQCMEYLKSYLLNEPISPEQMEIKTEFLRKNLSEQQLKDVYILRGLLSFEVLHHSLRKR